MSYRLVPPGTWGYGEPSKGLMQTIPMSFHTAAPAITDPLANMTAAVNYARSEYIGRWMDDGLEIRPRQGGKATAIARAEAISETVKPRPEMAEIMERAMASMPSYADGGIVPSPTGRLRPGDVVRFRAGEHIMTPEMARAAADRALARMTGDYYTTEERAAMDEIIRTAFEEPPDDYPEPPELPCF